MQGSIKNQSNNYRTVLFISIFNEDSKCIDILINEYTDTGMFVAQTLIKHQTLIKNQTNEFNNYLVSQELKSGIPKIVALPETVITLNTILVGDEFPGIHRSRSNTYSPAQCLTSFMCGVTSGLYADIRKSPHFKFEEYNQAVGLTKESNYNATIDRFNGMVQSYFMPFFSNVIKTKRTLLESIKQKF